MEIKLGLNGDFLSWLVVLTCFNPSENDGVRQIGSSSQLLGNIKNGPNHQPDSEFIQLIIH